MEEKEFDINNEEGILAKFDFYYCYNSEQCSKELCMFFNDISLNKRKNFDKRQAFIDLGRIAITLNQQDKRIKELESKLRVSNSLNASLSLEHSELKKQYGSQEKLLSQKLAENSRLTLENQQLKHKLAEKEKEIGEFKRIGEKGHLNDLLEDKRKENIRRIRQKMQRLSMFSCFVLLFCR